MPVPDVRRDHDHFSRLKTDRGLSFFLIPAFACRTDQQLSAAACGVMNMPVVAAPRLKRNVGQMQPVFRLCQRIEIRISDEVLRIGGVFKSESEYVLRVERFF